jgi:hypothetical protein
MKKRKLPPRHLTRRILATATGGTEALITEISLPPIKSDNKDSWPALHARAAS